MRDIHRLAAAALAALCLAPFGAAATTPLSFYTTTAAPQIPVSENMTAADLDGDGRPEIISVGGGAVCIVAPTFPAGGIDPLDAFPSFPPCYYLASVNWQSVAVADFNGDGKTDIATTLMDTSTVGVLLNDTLPGGDIAMHAGATFAVGSRPYSIAIADFDGDGRPDIATANIDGGVSVLINTTPNGASTASFAPQMTITTPQAFVIATGDFNGDGKPDIAFVSKGVVSILLNTTPAGASAPSFSAPQTAAAFSGNYALPTLPVVDLDGDGRPDIALPDQTGTLTVLFNTTPRSAAQTSFTRYPVAVTGNVYTVISADINGDGVPDLLAVGGGSNGSTLIALQNRTAPGAALFGGFDTQQFAFGQAVLDIVAADFNNDGKLDVVEGDYGSGPYGVAHLNVAINTTGQSFANLDQQALTGSWYNPATAGQGFEIEVYPDLSGSGTGLFSAGWFTYDTSAAGGRRWFLLSGKVSATEPLREVGTYLPAAGTFGAPPPNGAFNFPIGAATIQFADCNHALLHYEFEYNPNAGSLFPSGTSAVIPLTRLLPRPSCTSSGSGGPSAAPASLLSGNWYDPATPGQGFIFDMSPEAHTLFAAWYTYALTPAPQGTGAAQEWYTLQAPFVDAGAPLHDIPIVQTSGGVFDDPTATTSIQVGSADLTFQSCSAMTLSYRMTGGAAAGLSGTIPLQRVGPTPAGCALK